ncbi:MAG: DNA repair protein RecO, partial [Bacteroidota bacterium]
MIVRTDAVVLHTFDYGETSLIARLLTRQHGVIGVLARGARRTKSQFGSALQPLSYIEAVYYHKPQRGLQTLKEAAHAVRFRRLTADLGRLTLGLRIAEVTRALVEEGEAHPLTLEAVARALTFLDAAEENVANAVPWFQLRLAGQLGFAPDVQRDDVLALGDGGGYLLLQSGALLATDGSGEAPRP